MSQVLRDWIEMLREAEQWMCQLAARGAVRSMRKDAGAAAYYCGKALDALEVMAPQLEADEEEAPHDDLAPYAHGPLRRGRSIYDDSPLFEEGIDLAAWIDKREGTG